jgi:DNA-binding NtrC family response regulator
MNKTILIVDDDVTIRGAVSAFLEAKGYETAGASDVAEAQIVFRSKRPDVAVIDFILPDGDAIDLLERFRAIDESCPVIVLTGHGSIELAVRAIQEGASHFLTKPVDIPALQTVIERSLQDATLKRRETARKSGSRGRRSDPFAGSSAIIRTLEAQVRKVLRSDAPVLIQGETGTGKGVLARWMHEQGRRSDGPLVDLNCAGLTREFLDTELFGHEKGAFTGAVNAKQGLFEVAHGGTLFLDEIGDVDLQLQPKLLKVVEEKRFRRLGEVQDRIVDVRLIGATHRDLAALSREGTFRQDLFFRISTIPLRMPSLHERMEDLPMLAEMILDDLALGMGRRRPALADNALAAMRGYGWPGNLRELRNVLERAMLLMEHDEIRAGDLVLQFDAHGSQAAQPSDLNMTLEEMERRYIEQVLVDENGSVERAAIRLAVPRSSLYQKIKRYGVNPSRI